MSKYSSMRVIYHFICTKTLDCLYEERLMCLIRNCGCSNSELLRFCCLFCTARQEFIDLAYKYDSQNHISKQVRNVTVPKISSIILFIGTFN